MKDKKEKKERKIEWRGKKANKERKKWREFLVKRGTLWEMKIICTFAERKIIVIITIRKMLVGLCVISLLQTKL